MAEVSKATFYRHIKEKKISTSKDDSGDTVVEISELERVYDKLKSLEQIEKEKKNKSSLNETDRDIPETLKIQLELTQERLNDVLSERERERSQLLDQINTLKDQLEHSEEQRTKAEDQKTQLTMMLTDQRKDTKAKEAQEAEQAKKWDALEKQVQTLAENQNLGFWERHFGKNRKKS